MKISVIIPTYNRYHLLPIAIDSVLLQDYPADELIVVDDGSVDGTPSLLRSNYGDRIIRIHQRNRGVSAARNAGIMRARNEYLAFLDSDDWWHPHKLRKQVQLLEQNPDSRIAYTNEIWLLNDKSVNQHKHHQKFSGNMFYHSLNLCLISPSSILLHRSVFEKTGLFDENLPVCEDYDLWLKITSQYPVLYQDCPLVYKRGGHDNQLSRSLPVMDYYRIMALDHLILAGRLEPDQKRAAITVLRKKIGIVLKGSIKHDNQTMIRQIQPILDRYRLETET